jgi:coenzyme F420-reducing hydrogenase delta subunit
MASPSEFKPIVVGFLCNWCCYGGADLAGVSRFQYPSHLRVIRQMCSGRVDMEFILRSFLKGADGVFVGGCHLGDCHYNPEGNYDALGNSMIVKRILEHIGIDPDRLRLEWVSAGEGNRFAEVQNEIAATMKRLGPLGSAEGKSAEELQAALQAAIDMVPYFKLVERERFRLPVRSEENYHKQYVGDAKFDAVFKELILDKLTMSRIMGYVRAQSAATVEAGQIAAGLNLPALEVNRHLDVLAQRGMVKLDDSQVKVVAVA